ncbi:MAG TPA: M15 family metallopeptidase [Pyrinomonadaceae bacterium]|nr:M15 family metallopeptidase [Pyrinomonadaceae bacterium]
MKKKSHFVVSVLAIAAFAALVTFVARTGYGQSSQLKEQAPAASSQPNVAAGAAAEIAGAASKVKEAASEVKDAAAGASLFAAASARNTLLRYELNWAFGGKQQRGWYIYTPLISRMLSTDNDAATGDFASALSRWQKSSGLQPSGVLDDETLYRMVSSWQGARLKNKEYATPDQLLLAPTSDFYDPSRPDDRRQVERETYAAYKRMVAAAASDLGLKTTAAGELAPDEKFLKIVSAFRSREHQAALRAQSPGSGRAGLAVNSPHFTGRALDLYVGGEPVETKDSNRALQVQTPAYRWLVRNAERFGFRPYYYEPWHWEYVGASAAASN